MSERPPYFSYETRRCRLVEAKEVCVVMDGAGWLQPFVDMHRQDAVRILDFPHAALPPEQSAGGPEREWSRVSNSYARPMPASPQTPWPGFSGRDGRSRNQGGNRTGSDSRASWVWTQTALPDAVSPLSPRWVANRFRDG